MTTLRRAVRIALVGLPLVVCGGCSKTNEIKTDAPPHREKGGDRCDRVAAKEHGDFF